MAVERKSQSLRKVNEGDNVVDTPIVHDAQETIRTVEEKDRGVLGALFKTEAEKEVVRHQLKMVRKSAELVEKSFEYFSETKLKAVKEMYNDFLVKGKTRIRAERVEFFAEQEVALRNKVGTICREFMRDIMEEYNRLGEINVQFIRDQEEKRLQDNVYGFRDTVDKLLSDFKNILDEGLKE